MIKKNDLVIASKVRFCNSIFSKAMGLRFKFDFEDSAYVFSFEKSTIALMDMFFVFYPIDVVFLDNNKKVIEVKAKFLPFAFYKSKVKANYIIELECGAIKKFGIEIGDKLDF